jgi:hypothetical protein
LFWTGDKATCRNCNKSYTLDSYQREASISDLQHKETIGIMKIITTQYSQALENLLKQYSSIEELIEDGTVTPGKIINVDGTGMIVVQKLLFEYSPPEIYTAAYRIRSSMENWLKYERLFDPNSSLYPKEWFKRKEIFFKDLSNDFAEEFIKNYQLMNIFVHKNIENIFKKNFISEDDKITAILNASKFVDENKLYVADEIEGARKLLIKSNQLIGYEINRFFQLYPNLNIDDKEKKRQFNNDKKKLSYLVKDQTQLFEFLQSKGIQLNNIKTTKTEFAKLWKSKYQIDY